MIGSRPHSQRKENGFRIYRRQQALTPPDAQIRRRFPWTAPAERQRQRRFSCERPPMHPSLHAPKAVSPLRLPGTLYAFYCILLFTSATGSAIPKGLCPPAQGWRPAPTLGRWWAIFSTPVGGMALSRLCESPHKRLKNDRREARQAWAQWDAPSRPARRHGLPHRLVCPGARAFGAWARRTTAGAAVLPGGGIRKFIRP